MGQLRRREFLELSGAAVTAGMLLSIPGLRALAAAPPSRLMPADKGFTAEQLSALRRRGVRRTYRGAQRYAIGMPCGGIAAGQVYVLGDGTLGEWHLDGRQNFTGWGADSYRTRRPSRAISQGFRIVVHGNGQKNPHAILADPESGGSYDRIEFIGEYPVAEIRYRAGDDTAVPPVEVSVKVGSPFIPLDSRSSALPCTILRFTLHNRTDHSVEGLLQGWLENAVEPSQPGEPRALRRNRLSTSDGVSAVVMDAIAEPAPAGKESRPERLLFDFEQGDYAGWTVEGAAFGTGPAKGTQAHQNPVTGFTGKGLVNSYPGSDAPVGRMVSAPFTIDRRYMFFLIGGGQQPGKTCVNLVIDGKAVRTATGRNDEKLDWRAWDLGEFQGKEARFEIVDAASGPWGHVNVDDVRLSDTLPAALVKPRPDSQSNGSMALAFLGRGQMWSYGRIEDDGSIRSTGGPDEHGVAIGVVGAPFLLAPGESRELRFVISWFFPNLHTGRGQMYANWFEDALGVVREVNTNFDRLIEPTDLFCKTFYDETTLPWWLTLRLMMPVANLATGTAQWWKDGRFWAYEGVGSCHGTCTHVWNYSQAEAMLFPDLARSTRRMQDLGSAFEESTGRVAFRGEVHNGFEYAADGQAGTILKCFREHLRSGDDSFLKSQWPRIRKAMEFLITHDAAGSPDGQPDGILTDSQPNTFDIDFYGANTFVGSLYLAALLASAEMAERVSDPEFAGRCRGLAASGRAWTETNLFNGEYFIQKLGDKDSDRYQYGAGCLADQLFGQNWARTLGLGSVYGDAMVRRALESIYRYNWLPAVGPYAAEWPPERVFARDREGGLIVCTWPQGGRFKEPVRYRDEVWTGVEYQVAAGMVWEAMLPKGRIDQGLLDHALTIVKAIDDRYDGAVHNPWNEVECGDHYARAMASWGVLLALTGYHYDGPAGLLGMAPRLAPDAFAAFFSAAEGWGRLVQTRAPKGQMNRVELKWGKLALTAFQTMMPEGVDAAGVRCEAKRGSESIAVTAAAQGGDGMVRARLAVPLQLSGDDSLELRWSW